MRLLTGPGGVGKTRLAVELATRMRQAGWTCDRVADGKEAEVIGTLRAATRSRALLVADYAETRVGLGQMLGPLAAAADGKVRVLLVARTAGAWWDQLGATDPAVSDLTQQARAAQIDLAPVADPRVSDAEVVALAVKAFAAELGVCERAVAVEEGTGRRRMLDLHAAALVTLLDQTTTGTGLLSVDTSTVMGELLRHEQHFWYASARAAGLTQGPAGLSPQMLRQLVAAACLLGATTERQALDLTSRVPYMQPSINAARWLRELYPPDTDSPDWLGCLQPDRLAELHTVRELAGSPELTRACLARLDARQARRAVTLLGRAAADDHRAEALLKDTLPAAAGFLDDLDIPLDALEAIYHAIPHETVVLSADAAALARQINDLLPGGSPPAVRASWALELGLRLSDLGRLHQALPATKKAITIFRELTATTPDRYRADLARSLTHLGIMLTKLGHPDQALPVAEEAVSIRRDLATTTAGRYDLAHSLNNHGLHLAFLGRHDQALPVAEEAVSIHREVTASDPGRYRHGLARALGNLANRLSALGRPDQALPATQETVTIFRQLAAINPDRYRNDLALALGNLGEKYSLLARHDQALPATQEAITIFRELATIAPDRYHPDLAMALGNLGEHFSALGRHDQALPVTQEAIALYRELATIAPDRYRNDLAGALRTLGEHFSALGRDDQALPAAEESITIFRELSATAPDRYHAHLVRALTSRAQILRESGG